MNLNSIKEEDTISVDFDDFGIIGHNMEREFGKILGEDFRALSDSSPSDVGDLLIDLAHKEGTKLQEYTGDAFIDQEWYSDLDDGEEDEELEDPFAHNGRDNITLYEISSGLIVIVVYMSGENVILIPGKKELLRKKIQKILE